MLRRLLLSNVSRPNCFCSQNFVKRLCIASNSQNAELADFDIIDDSAIRDPSRDATVNVKTLGLLLKKFVHCFDVNEKEAKRLIDRNKALSRVPIDNISRNIELLYEKKITAKNIMDNPWLLGVPPKYLAQKIACVERLKPRDLNDFIPLVKVSPLVLLRTQKKMEREEKYIPEGNRIYFFSKRLNLEPIIISKYFSTHMFMFEVSQEMLFENLDIMLEYGIAPMSIIRDLWAFKYLGKSIRARFDRCKQGSKEILKPWMVRCTEDVLQRTLFLSQESKNVLGESTEVDYLSERLGYDKETIENLLKKHKGVLQVRIVKMKEILDYMLEVEKFEPHDIFGNLRILCHSLETTKARIEELKALGCRPSSLVILMKSQNEYNKFVSTWIARREKRKEIKSI